MKKINISNISNKDAYAIVDDCDYSKVQPFTWHQDKEGYIRAHMRGKIVSMHRFILQPPCDKVVDHKNMKRYDNRRSNLRVCTRAENLRNSSVSKNNKTGFKGVSKTEAGKFYAKITFNNKAISLGEHKTPIEAARAYDNAAKKYFGEFARLNLENE